MKTSTLKHTETGIDETTTKSFFSASPVITSWCFFVLQLLLN